MRFGELGFQRYRRSDPVTCKLAVKLKEKGLQGRMNKSKKYHCGLLVGAVIAFFILTSVNASDDYVRVDLPKGVSIELPKDWEVLSDGQRIALETMADSVFDLSDIEYGNDFQFAANYYRNDQIVGITIINYYPNDGMTQKDSLQATQQDISEMDTALKKAVVKPMKTAGMPILSWEGAKKVTFNGITAIVTEYRRKGIKDSGAFRVRLIRVFAGERSFTLTVSYLEEIASSLEPSTDRIISSLKLSGINDASVDEEQDSVFDINTARPVNDRFSSVDNSQVYTKPTSSNTDSLMSHLFGKWVIMLALWVLGLTPPLLIRFLFVRRPISKGWAIGTAVIFLFINLFLFAILEMILSNALLITKAHASSIFVAVVSYFILRKKLNNKGGIRGHL